MEQQQAASSSSSDQHKAVRKKEAFLFDYIPIVDATALANLFDQLRVETK